MPIGTIQTEGQLARFVETALDPLRTLVRQLQGKVPIRGEVSGAGAVLRGAGFTAAKNSTGNYTVTFDKPYAAPPVVVATGSAWVVYLLSITAQAFDVISFRTDTGAAVDQAFTFMAVPA